MKYVSKYLEVERGLKFIETRREIIVFCVRLLVTLINKTQRVRSTKYFRPKRRITY